MNIFTILTIIFIAFKVLKLVDWSWFQVFIPLIINVVLLIIINICKLIEYNKALRRLTKQMTKHLKKME